MVQGFFKRHLPMLITLAIVLAVSLTAWILDAQPQGYSPFYPSQRPIAPSPTP